MQTNGSARQPTNIILSVQNNRNRWLGEQIYELAAVWIGAKAKRESALNIQLEKYSTIRGAIN